MRTLVACPECRRQYDAGELSAGAKFRCGCGKVLRVKPAKGHDAAVVRCSGCGAPREKDAAACGHCGSDFTLHERDLHTVCPGCFTRVSDRAKYCHSCAKPLLAKTVVGERSKLQCPSCPGQPHLHSRRLGEEDYPMLECQLCAGLWIESRVFQELVKKAQQRELVDAAVLASAGKESSPPEEDAARAKWSYRPCPQCGKMMQRRNYARRSGVIIDVCRSDGIWFDADELQSILEWIHEGGLQTARARAGEAHREQEARVKIAKASQPSAGYDGDWFNWGSQSSGGSMLVDILIDSIFSGY